MSYILFFIQMLFIADNTRSLQIYTTFCKKKKLVILIVRSNAIVVII